MVNRDTNNNRVWATEKVFFLSVIAFTFIVGELYSGPLSKDDIKYEWVNGGVSLMNSQCKLDYGQIFA